VTAAGIISTSDIPLTILLVLTKDVHMPTAGWPGQLLTVLLTRPIPLILLTMGIFYLWIYLRHDPAQCYTGKSEGELMAPIAAKMA